VKENTMDTEPAGIGHNLPPDPINPLHSITTKAMLDRARLSSIHPEALLVLGLDEVAPLLDLQYAPLASRSSDLLARAENWARINQNPNGGLTVIDSDIGNNAASDLFRQLRDHAGDDGEIEETRKKVKRGPLALTKAIDAWFNHLRDRQKSAMAVIDAAQNAYVPIKLARERKVREELAAAVRAMADAAAMMARESLDDAEIDAAVAAEQYAAEAMQQATASVADMTRTRSPIGTTTSVSAKWTWKLDSIVDLCRAVAEGRAPADFVTTNDSVISALVRGKSGWRVCPGLSIYEEHKVRRSGS
jgi:hypothetical protein